MRISTVTMYEQSVGSLNQQQSDFLKVSQQLSSGRRVVNPSDDPQAASRAVGVDQAKAITQQYTDSRVSARNSLSQSESVLNSVSDAISSAKTLLIQASSDTLSDADRQSVASELRGVYETLFGQANAADGNGNYLFGGYSDDSEPFVKGSDGQIGYVGASQVREQRIDASRLMKVSDSGEAIFQSVPSGAGYVATADAANGGSVTFKGPQIVDDQAVTTDEAYTLSFDGDAASGYTYEVEDSDGNPVASGNYVPENGETTRVEFGGLVMELDGEPSAGDSIAINPADQGNTDLFSTLESALGVLESPAGTPAEKAALRNTLDTSMRELDNSLDNVLTVRASMGARLNELDVVDGVSSNRTLNYEQTLSDLVDLDYAEAISEYSLRQVGMQASQQTFANMKGMSLFQYL
ncbi:flagellar hook-associated protein FlgL [Halomonas organivorans]|uniref:Flagellar hook-associated protein 3 FlgL n=1 Tax=Halomonas organivorans TaxID=257772 RepID=A0A7W5G4T8_9GAMM|nr:flagellar hook-associated protein FlgL [Halomonas organivorans]MBB3140360.1 flagellar hook-associated protein 3 FlgL [Halomonas organivorans]